MHSKQKQQCSYNVLHEKMLPWKKIWEGKEILLNCGGSKNQGLTYNVNMTFLFSCQHQGKPLESEKISEEPKIFLLGRTRQRGQ